MEEMGRELSNEVIGLRKALATADQQHVSQSNFKRIASMYENIENCTANFRSQMQNVGTSEETDLQGSMLITQAVAALRRHVRTGKVSWLPAKSELVSNASLQFLCEKHHNAFN